MTAEIGELTVDEYLALARSAGRGEKNVFLERMISLRSSRAEAIDSARRFAKLIEVFAKHVGSDRRVCLFESPGRVNLMGMHIDHRGGIVNPVASRERICAVCSRRDDDHIRAMSLFRDFGKGQFRISDRVPDTPLNSLGQWLNWTEHESADGKGGGDFINYFACGPLYLACFHYPWGRRFAGADFVFDSDLPASAGLASSSALVILATDFFIRCNPQGVENLSIHELLDVYGNGEWYVGTRGGKGDHAAIKLCRRGSVQPVITTPTFRTCEPVHFLDGCEIILYQSGDEANKSVEPFKTQFNAPIISYQAAEMFLVDFLRDRKLTVLEELLEKRSSMDAKHHRVYLGDVINASILSGPEIYEFLRSLPPVMTRDDIFSRFKDRGGSFHDGIRQTNEPERGYHVRDAAAFGFSECARSRNAADMLAVGNADEFADMLNVSQLGDRVTDVEDSTSRRIKFLEDDVLSAMAGENFPVRRIAGDYHVSTPNIDRLVSICLSSPNVLGARLSGAGLGGTVIVLGRTGFDETLDPILQRDYYEPFKKEFQKTRIVPSQGAGFC